MRTYSRSRVPTSLTYARKYGPTRRIWLVAVPPQPRLWADSQVEGFPLWVRQVTLLISPTLGSTRFAADEETLKS